MKVKDVFYVLVRMNSTDAFLQFVQSFLIPLLMCFEVEAGNFTTLVYSILFNVGKSLLKMTETLWENSPIIAKDV
jgi:hypothetical protein